MSVVDSQSVKEYAVQHNLQPFAVEGIGEGVSFFHPLNRQMGDMMLVGYLVAFTPGYQWSRAGAMSMYPVVVPVNSSTDIIEIETQKQAALLAELYISNLKNLNQN